MLWFLEECDVTFFTPQSVLNRADWKTHIVPIKILTTVGCSQTLLSSDKVIRFDMTVSQIQRHMDERGEAKRKQNEMLLCMVGW